MKSLSKLSPAELEEVRALGATVLRKSVTKRTPVTKLEEPPVKGEQAPRPDPSGLSVDRRQTTGRESNPLEKHSTTRGRPKKYTTNAERQRAYRERSK